MKWLAKIKRSLTMGKIISSDLNRIIDNISKSDLPEATEYILALQAADKRIRQADYEIHGKG